VPASALWLALGAAGLHALWNLLIAGSRDSEAAMAVAGAIAALVFVPVAALTWDVRWPAAPYIAGSAAFQLAYTALLAAAYRRAELSLVYPLARGLAPVLVLGFSALVLGAATSSLEVGGVFAVGLGIILLRGLGRGPAGRGVLLAVAIGVCIAGYTLVDKHGLRYAEPVSYFEVVLAITSIVYLAAVAAAKGALPLRTELRPRLVVAGVAMFGAYALVLAALERAPAAPVAAVRESSVLIATALAAVWLRERVGLRRLAGAGVVVGGVLLVGAV
jgi:drug/metabolite transporter (DMT)-like permease